MRHIKQTVSVGRKVRVLMASLLLPLSFGAAASDVDFNNDGIADILWRNEFTKEMRSWTMNGGNLYSAISFFPSFNTGSDNWEVVALGDVNGDGITDIIFRDLFAGYNRVWIMSAAGNAISRSTIAFYPQFGSTSWRVIGVGDSNNDGTEDLFFHNTADGTVRIWEMDTNGNRESVCFIPPKILGYEAQAIADFDGDGDADIFWRKASVGTHRIWLMENCAVDTVVTPPNRSGTTINVVGAGDFDNDGTDDVLWVDTDDNSQTIWRMLSGTYNSLGTLSTPTTGNFFSGIGDYDNDGTDDILVYNQSTGNARIRWIDNLTLEGTAGLPNFGAGGQWDIIVDKDN